MLFGIKDSTGLGNNADELDTAEAQLMKRVIAPKQRFILEALDDILNAYNINLNLYFIPLTEQTQTTDVAMSSHVCCSDEKKKSDLDLFIGSRSLPFSYPLPDRSFVLINETKKVSLHFVTPQLK